jgi:hypothetical protein
VFVGALVEGGAEFAPDGYPYVSNPRTSFRLVRFGQLTREFHITTFIESNAVLYPHKARKASSAGSKRKALNLDACNFRSPGDYVRTIRLSDCTDLFSTQLVSVYLHCMRVSTDSTPCSQPPLPG